MIDPVTAVMFPQSWNMHREPVRPKDKRIDYCGGMRFDDNFDWNTIWYDCVRISNNYALLIGPPIYLEEEWFNANVKFTDAAGNPLSHRFANLDRVSVCVVQGNNILNSIIMQSTAASPISIILNQDDGYFSGHRVMVTLQRDNPLSWIKQWIDYHYTNHNITGFLIYDNASKLYSAQEIDAQISNPNIKVKIIPWPFPYGPQGSDFAPWDSDYGQYCMLEHAKHRHLSQAAMVINNDIDELIVTDNTNFDDIQRELKMVGCMLYQGVWIEPYDIVNQQSAHKIPLDKRHFANYHCTDDTNTRGIGFKWLLDPKLTYNSQWLVHRIGMQSQTNTRLWYAHHLSMNTNWSWQRDHFTGNVNNLQPNQNLIAAQARISV